MKTAIFHISDLHIKTEKSQRLLADRWKDLRSSLGQILGATEVKSAILVFTGDIAFSGKREQYQIFSAFLRGLVEYVKEHNIDDVHTIIIPGNHDLDLDSSSSGNENDVIATRDALIDSITKDVKHARAESVVRQITKVQDNFRNLLVDVKASNELSSEHIVSQVQVVSEEQKIVFYLVNSAWMSKQEERQGTIIIPIEEASKIKRVEGAIAVVLTHHPYSWFSHQSQKELKRNCEQSADIILTGHEHQIDVYEKKRALSGIMFSEGHIFLSEDNQSASGFCLLVIDHGEKCVTSQKFCFENGSYVCAGGVTKYSINGHLRLTNGLIKSEFLGFLSEVGICFSHPRKKHVVIDDIYIEPLLEKISGTPFKRNELSLSAVINESDEQSNGRQVLICGDYQSGKTTLGKKLFDSFAQRSPDFIPVLMDKNDFDGHSREKVFQAIERKSRKIFCEDCFSGAIPRKRVVIIDDFDKLPNIKNARQKKEVIDHLSSICGHVSECVKRRETVSQKV